MFIHKEGWKDGVPFLLIYRRNWQPDITQNKHLIQYNIYKTTAHKLRGTNIYKQNENNTNTSNTQTIAGKIVKLLSEKMKWENRLKDRVWKLGCWDTRPQLMDNLNLETLRNPISEDLSVNMECWDKTM